MQFMLLALYGGPDQVLTITSSFAAIVGVLLIFWNKVAAGCVKLINRFRSHEKRGSTPPPTAAPEDR